MNEDELLKAIQRLPKKQYASDPIPTWLLKKISGMILPFVKSMVNQSFIEGIVPKVLEIGSDYNTVEKA